MTYSVKYKRVFDKDGHIVTINDVTKENRASEYYSIGTHTPMVAALGDKNQHYFRAKRGYSINPETELHQYAKYILKYRFDHDEHFDIQFMRKEKCPFDNKCIFYDEYDGDCPMLEEKKELFDLKQYYDTATIEKEYDSFVADVLLTNSKKKDQKPVFLEVYVTHLCSEEKINSGNKIIEVKIEREDDAFADLFQSNNYCEGENTIVTFYNFKEDIPKEDCNHHVEKAKDMPSDPVIIKKRVSVKYFCYPRQSSDFSLQKYFENIQIGMPFSSSYYCTTYVFDKAIVGNKLIVITKDIDTRGGRWLLYIITQKNNFFHHIFDYCFNYQYAITLLKIKYGIKWGG